MVTTGMLDRKPNREKMTEGMAQWLQNVNMTQMLRIWKGKEVYDSQGREEWHHMMAMSILTLIGLRYRKKKISQSKETQ